MKKDINSSDWLISKGYYDMILNSSPENAIYTHEALTEYSDLKCQPLLERIKELEAYQTVQLMEIELRGEELKMAEAKIQELQEAADKLAEAIDNSEYQDFDMVMALKNYNKLKGK